MTIEGSISRSQLVGSSVASLGVLSSVPVISVLQMCLVPT